MRLPILIGNLILLMFLIKMENVNTIGRTKVKKMPKASLEFDLNDPDDKRDFELVNKVDEMYSALFDLYNMARDHQKYDPLDSAEKVERFLEEIREVCSIVMD